MAAMSFIPVRPGPSVSKMLFRGFTLACPACGRRGLFRRWVLMADDCPRCGLHFERIEGHWIGAIGINTIVSFVVLLVTMLTSFALTHPDYPTRTLMILALGVSILTPTVFLPISRTLWTSIDISMRPLEATEVDWQQVDPELRLDDTPEAQTHEQPQDQSQDQSQDQHGEHRPNE